MRSVLLDHTPEIERDDVEPSALGNRAIAFDRRAHCLFERDLPKHLETVFVVEEVIRIVMGELHTEIGEQSFEIRSRPPTTILIRHEDLDLSRP